MLENNCSIAQLKGKVNFIFCWAQKFLIDYQVSSQFTAAGPDACVWLDFCSDFCLMSSKFSYILHGFWQLICCKTANVTQLRAVKPLINLTTIKLKLKLMKSLNLQCCSTHTHTHTFARPKTSKRKPTTRKTNRKKKTEPKRS